MNKLFWLYAHRVLTCEIFTSNTAKQVEKAFLEPRKFVLHTQRYQPHLSTHEMMENVPRSFDWRELLASASQFANNDYLEQSRQWLM